MSGSFNHASRRRSLLRLCAIRMPSNLMEHRRWNTMENLSDNPGIGPPGPELSPKEVKIAEKRTVGGAAIVHETVRLQGEEELSRPSSALAWSALAAGLAMGFSLVAEGALRAYLPDTPWRPLITKLGYPVGFLIVIIGRQQLFTENTLTPIIPLL